MQDQIRKEDKAARMDRQRDSTTSRTAGEHTVTPTSVTPNHVSDVLTRAADIVARGWCQGSFGYGSKERCMWGALMDAGKDAEFSDYESASAALLRCVDTSFAGWNDAPGRTQAEVVAKLREAAALAASEAR